MVVDDIVSDGHVTTGAQVKTIRVMGRRKTTTYRVRRISRGIVQKQIFEDQVGAAGDTEEMSRPVLDVEVLNHGSSCHLVDNNEVVRSRVVRNKRV